MTLPVCQLCLELAVTERVYNHGMLRAHIAT